MSQTFSISRYGALLRRYLVENRKQLLFLTATMWGVMMITAFYMGRWEAKTLFAYEELRFKTLEDLFMVLTMESIAFACLWSANAFFSLRSKQMRITTLMAPASMVEKYLVRLTVYVIGFFMAFVIGTIPACGAHYIWMSQFDVSPIKYLTMWHYFHNGSFSILLALQAMYLFGGVIWPKFSFFKTFLAQFVIMLIFSMPIHEGISLFKEWFFIGVAVICYALAWWRFRRVQVIQRFM
ncbi:MAG: hypothetical protein K2M97_03485 [Muribaculaceae bacterium]|nr:hypothetical protein [Muribaculaceae bacterium]